MTLQLIGAGWPRTGTGSVKLALEQLGIGRCYHMREVVMNAGAAIPLWIRAAEGQPDWEAIFAGYAASTDAPGCVFWRELAAYYPDAKVLLSERDPEEWFRSTQESVFSPNAVERTAATPLRPFFEKVVHRDFGARIHDHDFMIDAFRRHNAEVRRAIPPERLLVYQVSEGWGPLCALLGVPVPDAPFPHTNTREEMAAIFSGRLPDSLEQLQAGAQSRFAERGGRPPG
jgi:hypothetical protein